MLRQQQPRRNTKALSEAVRAQHEGRRKHTILTVTGIGRGELVWIEPDRFGELDVDPSYQRGETKMVGDIINVINAGGQILDPVTLCRRTKWGERKKLFIVDGYQRVCAFQQMGVKFAAMVHESESLESEKRFFLALNNRKAVSADVIVKSWTGPSGRMIVQAAHSQAHPLCERVNFSQGHNGSRISAAIVLRAMFAGATGLEPTGSIQRLLSRCDLAVSVPRKKELAEQALRIMGDVFPKGGANLIVAGALGITLHKRMEQEGKRYPTDRVLERLMRVNWRTELPVISVKYRPVVIAVIEKIWQ